MTATAIGAYATVALLKARTGIGDTVDDTELGKICDQVNQYVESKTGRIIAPIASSTFTLDGDGTTTLWYPDGLRTVTLVRCAYYTSAAYITVDPSQYFLRPNPPRPGWPYQQLVFTDYPTGAFTSWPIGRNTVEITATTGWPAIPDDITEIALVAAIAAWFASQSGQQNMVGTDDMGRPLVSRFFSARDLETLRLYGVDLPG